jgi:hypothetical protein
LKAAPGGTRLAGITVAKRKERFMATQSRHISITASAALAIVALAGIATMIFGDFAIGLVAAIVGTVGLVGLAASYVLRPRQAARLSH